MERILTVPKDFPKDSSQLIGNGFSTFYDESIDRFKVIFDGLEYLRDVYVSRDTIERILEDTTKEDCAGFVFYCAKVKVINPTDPTKEEDQITIAVVGVTEGGILRNQDGQGACYITRPCPPYCDTWGI